MQYKYIVIEGGGSPGRILNCIYKQSNRPNFGNDTSETVFWKSLNMYALNGEYIIYPMQGIKNLGTCLDTLLKQNVPMNIIIIPDWYTVDSVRMFISDTLNEKEEYIESHNLQNVSISLVTGYTFEWAIASFPELIDWLYVSSIRQPKNDNQVKSKGELELEEIVAHKKELHRELLKLNRNPEKWDTSEGLKRELNYFSVDTESFLTFEQVCAAALSLITNRRPFLCHKGVLGPCWYTECRSSQCFLIQNFKEVSKVPTRMKCGLLHKNSCKPTLKYKYTELKSKSLAIKNMSLKMRESGYQLNPNNTSDKI